VIATTIDNRKWQCACNRKYLYLGNYDICDRNSKDKYGVFNHAEFEEIVAGLRQRSTTGNGNIDVLGANLAIFGFPSLSQSLGCTFIDFVMAENAGFVVGISMFSHSFRDINISGFGGHFLLSVVIEIA